MHNKLKGMGVALVTPFKVDGAIDFDALERLVEFQIASATDYLVVLGTTAETPTLSEKERQEVMRAVVAMVKGRIPVVLGMGSNDTHRLIDTVHQYDLSGVDALLSVTPYYNKPSQEGLYRHYATLAEASPLPIVLYNVPGRTGVNMQANTTLRLANDFKNIVAIKEASGNLPQIEEILRNKPEHFSVISGDDGNTYPLIKMGAIGVISVLGNAFPSEFGKMVRLALNGELQQASLLHEQFTELINLLFVEGSPAGVKSMLAAKGFIGNNLRLPLVPTTEATYNKICQALKTLL